MRVLNMDVMDYKKGLVGITNTKEIVIERVEDVLKGKKQAYYEMVLSTMVMSNLFYEWGYEDLSKVCSDWYLTLFYDEDFIYKYITEDEIAEMWHLR